MYDNKHLIKVRVWDLPTRTFHWALVLLIIFLVISGLKGGDAMLWHFRLGYAVLSLLLFRIIWGMIGGRWSRFSTFIYTPRSVINYLKGQGKPEHSVGHNPLGAASVFAMLAALLAQVGSGLISDDEIAFAGPLTPLVPSSLVSMATHYHKNIGKWLLLTLVLLHLVAIVYYLLKKHKLVQAMLHGDKALTAPAPASRDDALSRLGAVLVCTLCAAVVAWMVSFT